MRRPYISIFILCSFFMLSCGAINYPPASNNGDPTSASGSIDENPYEECLAKGLSLPDKEKCMDRVKNCYQGMNSRSLICKRKIEDLVFVVKPAELIEIDGRLVRHEGNMYLVDNDVEIGDGLAIKILNDSCAKEESEPLCLLQDETIVTLIGAYYSAEQSSMLGKRVVGSMLALDLYEGGRPVPPPVE